MWNSGLDEAQAGKKITRRNINNFSYAGDATLMAESEEEVCSGSWWWTGRPGILHAVHGVAKSRTWLSDNWTELNTVKGFGIISKAEIDVFLELSCFFNDPEDVSNLISGSSAFSKTNLKIWKFTVHILLKPGLENFEHYFTRVWDECNCAVVWAFFGITFPSSFSPSGDAGSWSLTSFALTLNKQAFKWLLQAQFHSTFYTSTLGILTHRWSWIGKINYETYCIWL